MDDRLRQLLTDLRGLHAHLRQETKAAYTRINPFCEDLFPWKERGEFWTGNESVTIYNSTTLVGDVQIGDETWVGPYCSLDGQGGLSIGRHCSISLGCQLLTHDTVAWALSGGAADYAYAPIRVGDCCFLGTYAVVLKGVSIGDRSLVAAGAVVSKDVPANTIVAGVPARPVGRVRVDDAGHVELIYERPQDALEGRVAALERRLGADPERP